MSYELPDNELDLEIPHSEEGVPSTPVGIQEQIEALTQENVCGLR